MIPTQVNAQYDIKMKEEAGESLKEEKDKLDQHKARPLPQYCNQENRILQNPIIGGLPRENVEVNENQLSNETLRNNLRVCEGCNNCLQQELLRRIQELQTLHEENMRSINQHWQERFNDISKTMN